MTESGDPLPLRTIIVSLVCILFGFAIPGNAQELACAEVVDRALLEIGENCQNLERDSLCYGHGNVAASFTSGFDAADFSEPGARAPLAALERLQTSGLELEAQTLGVAVMNLQAHLPNTRPGSGVIAMLVGEAALTNEVDPTLIQKIRDPISTATTKSATLFAQPNTIAEESERLPAGSIVLVDAVTSEREWMRVVKDGRRNMGTKRRLGTLAGDGFVARYRCRRSLRVTIVYLHISNRVARMRRSRAHARFTNTGRD